MAIERDKIRTQAPQLADLIGRMSEAKAEGRDPFSVIPVKPTRIRTTPLPLTSGSRRSRSQPENKVIQACFRVLQARGIFAWRNNTGCAWIGNRPIRYGLPGSADILGLLPNGRFLAVECKSAKGRQSDTQKTFEELVVKNNGVYILARSAEDLEKTLERI